MSGRPPERRGSRPGAVGEVAVGSIALPLDRPRAAGGTSGPRVGRVGWGTEVPEALIEGVGAAAAKGGTSPVAVLLGAFLALLCRWAGQDDLPVGLQIDDGQPSTDGPRSVRADLSGDPRLGEIPARAAPWLAAPEDGAGTRGEPVRFRFVRGSSVSEVGSAGPDDQEGATELTLAVTWSDGAARVVMEAAGKLFDRTTVRRLVGAYLRVLERVVGSPDRRLGELDLLGTSGRHQALVEWNDTGRGWGAGARLEELVFAQAERTPEAVALVGLEHGGDETRTYRELAAEARSLAARLRARGVGPEVRVGVFLDRRPELVTTLLGILAAGGAYVPLDPGYPEERVRFMLEDAGVAGVISATELAGALPEAGGWRLWVDEDEDDEAAHPTEPGPAGGTEDSLAYVIYTSGSTGRPKGVGIRHGGAVAMVRWAGEVFGPERLASTVAATSVCFDLSVFELFAPLSHGGRVVLVDDALALARPEAARGAVLVNTVPSVLAELLRAAPLPPSVRTVNLAGEALGRPLVDQLYALDGIEGVWNLYGPSEDTTYSTFERVPRGTEAPAIGRPVRGTRAYVTDRELRPVAVGASGELSLGGEGLARGYLGRPGLTAERFVPDPFGTVPGGRLYRTGDRVRLAADGRLEYLGRLDRQVKLRGFRIELGEVEAALGGVAGVGECAVVVRDDRMVAYAAGENLSEGLGSDGLRAALEERLPGYMVPGTFVLLDALPQTPTGKIDRRALPDPEEAGGVDRTSERPITEPRTPVEREVAGIWSELLGIGRVGLDDRFVALGGHSLLAVRMVSRLRDRLGVEVGLSDILAHDRLRDLAEVVEAAQGRPGSDDRVTRRSPGVRLPLSYGQEQLWLSEEGGSVGQAYNVPLELRLDGPLDLPAFARAVGEVVGRHEALRTRLAVDGDGVYQVVGQVVGQLGGELEGLPVVDLAGLPPGIRSTEADRREAEHARRALPVTGERLSRRALFRLSQTEHRFLWVLHHAVFDGWSLGLVVRELAAFYELGGGGDSTPLPTDVLSYGDFTLWQRERLQGPFLDRLQEAWRAHLDGAPPESAWPLDRPRPVRQSYRGRRLEVGLPAELARSVDELGRHLGVTSFMVLASTFAALLGRAAGQDDVVVGIPSANRTRTELEPVVGLFVNTLPLRVDLAGDPRATDLVDRVAEATLAAFSSQELPFSLILDAARPARDPSRNPLFQCFFQYLEEPDPVVTAGDVRLTPRELGNGTAKADLELTLVRDGDRIGGFVELNTDLLDETTALRLVRSFERLAAGMCAAPERRLEDLDALSPAERHQVLSEWNDTTARFPERVPVHRLFEARAAEDPAADALRFGDETLTYGSLDRRANRLARALRRAGVEPGALVAVALERSIDLVVAWLGVLKAGATYVPLAVGDPAERTAFVLADSGARVILVPDGDREPGVGSGERAVLRLTLSEALAPVAEEDDRPLPGPDLPATAPAYVMYTSGSTGRPKGVAVSHRAIVRLVAGTDYLQLGPGDRVAHLSNTAFDAATFEVWGPLLNGGQVVGITREEALSPERLASALAHRRVDALFVTTALFNEVAAARPDAFDPVGTVLFGGESVDPTWPRSVLETAPPGRLLHVYGPTESTTFATWEPLTSVPLGATTLPIGRPIANTRCHVLDRSLRPVAPGGIGELCLGGDGLALGYLGRGSLTAERFVPDPFSAVPGERLYRTGDLVRLEPDGRTVYRGRLDHQVKLRGFRIELGEVEAALGALDGVAECAVLVAGTGAGRRLVAYVSGDDLEAGALREGLEARLPAPMVPAAFVLLDELPWTPSGKIDRRALPDPMDRAEGAAGGAWGARRYVAPGTPTERALAELWAELLGVDRVGLDDRFFELGGHSLLAVRMVSRLRDRLGVEVGVGEVLADGRLGALAERIARRSSTVAEEIPRRAENARVPLSHAQEQLWFLDQGARAGAAYNVPVELRLQGALDLPAFARALTGVVARHEALRTRLVEDRETVAQVVDTAPERGLPVVDLQGLPGSIRGEEADRRARDLARAPFRLAGGRLERRALLRVGGADHLLVWVIHHAVFDGWSLGVVVRELGELYLAPAGTKALPEPGIGYGDLTLWQREHLRGEERDRLVEAWRERLDGAPPESTWPLDRPRPVIQSFAGRLVGADLAPELARGVEGLARRLGATPFMVLVSAFFALLSRVSGQDDVVVGVPSAGRSRSELEGMVGLLVNTLPLRADLAGSPTFEELVGRVREGVVAMEELQELPFAELVESLAPERDPGRNPIFQVMFQSLESPYPRVESGGVTMTGRERFNGTAKMDLNVSVAWSGGAARVGVEASRELFDPTTVRRFVGSYLHVVEQVVGAPERRLGDLDLLGASGRHQALVEWNDTGRGWGAGARLEELVFAQAERTPEAVALVGLEHGGEETWTYAELASSARSLAARLRAEGVGPEVRVGVFLDRRPELVPALLAILAAGGAYVPLDPGYPRERLRFMLEDSGVAGVISATDLAGALPEVGGWRLWVDGEPEGVADPGTEPVPVGADESALAYVIYTSGSTGRPKGVGIRHGGAVAMVRWAGEVFGPERLASTVAATSVCFDLSVFELFAPLSHGGRVVLVDDALALARPEAARGAVLVNTVPSVLAELLRAAPLPPSVRTVNLAGEALGRPLVAGLYARDGVEGVWNLYGPSEDTTYSTFERVPRGTGEAPAIGRPVWGTRAYVTDRELRAVPVAASGELALGGEGLARGYLGRPGLTAERFVPDPFGTVPGGRLYRTGDRVRLAADGRLEYLGRLDRQVKLRGFRIELGEVEAALGGVEGVGECAVVVRDDRMVAYAAGDRMTANLTADGLRATLEERLPGYMVPGTFVLLDALPHTPTGKIDRRALPDPEGDGSTGPGREIVEPRTVTETLVAALWREVLGIERVGVTEDFFRLGGHSLKALHITTTVRTRFGLDLPLAVLFRAPTIERMARLIDDGASESASPLVQLGPPAEEARGELPFYCVHGVGGNVFRLVDLARLIGRSFYGLQGWSDLNDVDHLDSVDKMAERYLGEIRRIQPHGPYLIGGLCVGSMVAFEMARRLEEAGEPVGFVGVINTQMARLAEVTTLDAQLFEVGIANELRIPISPARLQDLSPDKRLAYVVEEGRRLQALPPDFTLDDAHRYIEIFRRNFTAGLRYEPVACGAAVTLFVATEDGEPENDDPTWGWNAYAGGGVEVIGIPGNNASMLRSPQVEVFAAKLGDALDRAEAAALGSSPPEAALAGETERS